MIRINPISDARKFWKTFCYFSLGLIFFLLFSINAQTVRAQTYVSVFGGINLYNEADITDKFLVAGVQATGEGSLDTDRGHVVGFTIGKRFDNISVELELSHRENDLDDFDFDTISAVGTTLALNLGNIPLEGTHSSRSALINAWVDLPMGNIRPYFGGGLGVTDVNLEIDTISGATSNFDESDTVMAFQLGAGLKFAVSDNVSLDLGYRFFGADDPVHDDGVDEVELEYQNHSVLLRIIFAL